MNTPSDGTMFEKSDSPSATADDAGTCDGPPRIAAIARGEYVGLGESGVQGSGYVVESLEAALWCFAQTHDYRSAVLRAAILAMMQTPPPPCADSWQERSTASAAFRSGGRRCWRCATGSRRSPAICIERR